MKQPTKQNKIGAQIAHHRHRIGLTQQQLGDALGIAKSQVSGYENGHRKPSQPMLEKIAAALKCKVETILSPIT